MVSQLCYVNISIMISVYVGVNISNNLFKLTYAMP